MTLARLKNKLSQYDDKNADELYLSLDGEYIEDIEIVNQTTFHPRWPNCPTGWTEFIIDIRPRLSSGGNNLKKEYENLQNNFQIQDKENKELIVKYNNLVEKYKTVAEGFKALDDKLKNQDMEYDKIWRDFKRTMDTIRELQESYNLLGKSIGDKKNSESIKQEKIDANWKKFYDNLNDLFKITEDIII